jgi:hypothetical protein
LTLESSSGGTLHCANHPNTETNLRCSRCGKPICVRCVVQTPVGGRCRECANVRKAPIFLVSPRRYAMASGYGLGTSLVGGVIWAFMGGFFGLSFLVLLLLGYLVGEAVSRGAGGRVSRGLAVMAGAFTVLGPLFGRVCVILVSYPSASVGPAIALALQSLLGLFGLISLVLAVVIAVSRVR